MADAPMNARAGPGNPNWRGGKWTHPLYWTHRQMVQRCANPNHARYADYGGRGITVDPRWLDFWTFVEEMGERPEGHVLDRINNDGPYTASNCRWATVSESNRNRRRFDRPRDGATGRFTR